MPAELEFGARLTLITGPSDTGKTHVVECIDFALGSGSGPEEIDERAGYEWVSLEVDAGGRSITISRSFDDPDYAILFEGSLADWRPGLGDRIRASIKGSADPPSTLSGRLLEFSGFEPGTRIVSSQSGKSQNLSFRTFAPLAIIEETRIVEKRSPVLSGQRTEEPANRSVFQLVLTGIAPEPAEMEAIKDANDRREAAGQKVQILDRMIGDLRREAGEKDLDRGFIETDLARMEQELADLSEIVAQSGARLRHLLAERNHALREAEAAERDSVRSRELEVRFELLGQHYEADIRRLDFVIEGGHFFKQIAQSHCPTCGQPISAAADCHPEAGDVAAIERAAAAEKAKLSPRMKGLKAAIEDAQSDAGEAEERARRFRLRAAQFDNEIREVANPSAENARGRVNEITKRRRTLEADLLRFRELDRYLEARQEAANASSKLMERYRSDQDLDSLRVLADEVKSLLVAWQFRVKSDVVFDPSIHDLVIDGKRRSAFGKGSRAVTHAAFAVGLMEQCLAAETPHPGFVLVDTPLTTYKDKKRRDPEVGEGLHSAFLTSLAALPAGQAIIVENIDPPADLGGDAVVHRFVGEMGSGRSGFYPDMP